MGTVNSWAQLNKVISKKVTDSLKKEVFVEVSATMKEHVQDDVYDKYHPTKYIRRLEDGGIIADENIVGSMDSDTLLTVENVTPFNIAGETDDIPFDTTLAEVIETGIGYSWVKSKIYKTKQPRPFVANTITDLSENKGHVEALKTGLIRNNLKVK